jgi:hypothetical protein
MGRFIEGCDRREQLFLPACVDDYGAEDSPVRVVDVFVDELDRAALGFAGAAGTGRPGYPPSTMLKLYFYLYLNQVQSSRRSEREAGRKADPCGLPSDHPPNRRFHTASTSVGLSTRGDWRPCSATSPPSRNPPDQGGNAAGWDDVGRSLRDRPDGRRARAFGVRTLTHLCSTGPAPGIHARVQAAWPLGVRHNRAMSHRRPTPTGKGSGALAGQLRHPHSPDGREARERRRPFLRSPPSHG